MRKLDSSKRMIIKAGQPFIFLQTSKKMNAPSKKSGAVILLFLFLLMGNLSKASDYYWVGGTGNWTDFAAHWATSSGGNSFYTQAPTQNDNVYFDAASFTAAGQSVNVNIQTITCKSMDWSGATNNPNFYSYSFVRLNSYGSLKLIPGMTLGFTGALEFNFYSTVSGNTITTAGKSLYAFYFKGIGGSWILNDAVNANYVSQSEGQLNTNNQILNVTQFSSTGNAQSLILGSSVINTSTWDASGAVLNFNAGTSHIRNNGTFFNGGGKSYNKVTFDDPYPNYYTISVTGSNSFDQLTISPNVTMLSIEAGKVQTVNSLIASGTCGKMITISSGIAGTATTLLQPSGTVNGDNLILKDITATGGAVFNATNSINAGNVNGWTFTPRVSKNFYWIGGTGTWNSGSHWSYTSGGAANGCSPSSIDNVFFDANSFTASGQTVTVYAGSGCKNMDWTDATNSPALYFYMPYTNIFSVYGSLKLHPAMSISSYRPVSFYMQSTSSGNTVTTAGIAVPGIVFNGTGGEWTLLDDLSSSDKIECSAGIVNLNAKTINCRLFYSYSTVPVTVNAQGAVFNVTNYWSIFGSLMFNQNNSTVIKMGGGAYYDCSFTGAGLTYHKVVFSHGQNTINGNNTFDTLAVSPGKTLYIEDYKTQTINHSFVASGTPGNLTVIRALNIFASIKSATNICIDYVNMQRLAFIKATPCIQAYTGANSLNSGSNSNWLFAACGTVPLYNAIPLATLTNTTANCDDGAWKNFYDINNPGRIIASVKDNGNNLGAITASVYVDAAPANYLGRRLLNRHYVIKPATQPTSATRVRLYFTDAEFNALKAVDSRLTAVTDMGVLKYQGPTEDGIYNPADATGLQTISPADLNYGTAYGVNYAEFDVTGFSEFWMAAVPAGALNFDGTDDGVIVSNNPSLQINNGTIETWIKTSDAGSSYRGVIIKQLAYGLFLKDNVLMTYDWQTLQDISTGINIADNQWHHIAMTFSNGITNGSNIYLDGTLVKTFTYHVLSQGEGLVLGIGASAAPFLQTFKGNLEETRIWNRVLCIAEIQNNRNCELVAGQNGLVAYYKFNQGIAAGNNPLIGTLADESGNNLTGALNNFSLAGATSNWLPGTITGTCASFVLTTWYQDADNDGYYISSQLSCSSPGLGWHIAPVSGSGDCDDNNASVYPGTTRGCYTGPPGTAGIGACHTGTQTCQGNGTWSACGGQLTPVPEICNGIDDNCNGLIDEGVVLPSCTACVNGSQVNLTPVSSITPAGPTVFCEGSSVALTASAGSSYSWSNGATSQSITVNQTGNYTVTVTNGSGCSATSAATSVTVNPLPVTSISANTSTTFCEGSTVVLNASAGSTFLWSTGATSQSISVTQAGDYFVTVTNSSGCSATSPATTVTVNPLPVAFDVNGGGSYCYGGAGVEVGLSNSQTGINYQLMNGISPVGSIIPGTGFDISFGYQTVTGIYTVFAISAAGNCASNMNGSVSVMINPLPSAVIIGTATICNGNSTNITFNGTSNATIAYRINDGSSEAITLDGSGSATLAVSPIVNSTYAVIAVTSAANCTSAITGQSVSVTVNAAPLFSNCPSNITANVATGVCGTPILFTAINTGTPDPVTTYVFSGATTGSGSGTGSGSIFNTGVTNVQITATNFCGSTICSFSITVTDNEKPSIASMSNVSANNDASKCEATVMLVAPATTDNCGIASVVSSHPSSIFPVGTTTVTWTVTDIHGNTNSTSLDVVVTDNENPTITAASNVSGSSDAGKCEATVTLVAPATTDNCGIESVVSSHPSSIFPVGTTTVTWTATDIHGNTNSTSLDVVVTDNENPTIVTASNVSANSDAGKCEATVTLVAPATTDNCGIASVVSSHPSSIFPVGTTTVTWSVMDIHGNSNAITQTVTVTDSQLPLFTAISNISVNSDAGTCEAIVILDAPAAADNCAVQNISSDHASTTFPVGTTTVTWSVTDIHGNNHSAIQTVTVVDNIAPIITCPAHIRLSACESIATWATPAASDNCSGVTVIQASGPVSGSSFANGTTTTISYTATDASGNQTNCSFTVTRDEALIVTSSSTALLCYADSSLVTILATGGTTGYSYTNGTIINTTGIFNQAAGTLSYTVIDANGCAAAIQVTIAEPSQISTTASVTSIYNGSQISCNGKADGQITITASGGVGTLSYSIGTASNLTGIFNGLVAATYNYFVTDANGCVRSAPITIAQPANLLIADTHTEIGCLIGGISTVNITVTGGTTPYSFKQQGTIGVTNTTGLFTQLPLTPYTYTVTDVNGCLSNYPLTIMPGDYTPPAFTRPADITIPFSQGAACYNASPLVTGNIVNPTDNLTSAAVLGGTYTDVVYQCGFKTIIKRTWHLEDGCQNAAADQVQTITVTDNNTPYIVYAIKEAKFGQGNIVNGSVGVSGATGRAEFMKDSKLLSPDFVKAANISVNSGATVNMQYKFMANDGPAPAFYPFAGNTKNLGNFTVSNSTPIPVTGNYKKLKIKKNVTVTVSGTLYGEIEIEQGAKVTFNPAGGVLNIGELKTEGGNDDDDDDHHQPGATYIFFGNCTSVRIKDKVDIGRNTQLNVGGPRVTFYLGDDRKDEEKFMIKGGNTQITANIYIKDGKLKVNGCGDTHNTHTIMTGWFIAEKFESTGKNVIWNKNGCNIPSSRSQEAIPISGKPATGEHFDVRVLPNPSTTNFRLLVETYSNETISIRLMDASGRVLQSLTGLSRNNVITVGDKFINGTYFAEVIQGSKRKVVTLIKLR